MSESGPLKSQVDGVSPLVEKFESFESLRHFMAHGSVEVALKQCGEAIYVFRMIDHPSDGSPVRTLALTPQEAQSRRAKLAIIATPLASKLEAIAKGLAK